MNSITNHYEHCNDGWEVEGCDSYHNDRCPTCNKEITPVASVEYNEDGEPVLTEDHRND